MEGLLAGLAIGAVVAVGVVATGGLGAIAVGAALATTGAAGVAGALIGGAMDGPDTGQLETGSPNVRVNGLAGTMVQLASGHCSQHGPGPRLVASGSATVKINGQPAARVTETMDCAAVIRIGSPNVNIGGPKQSPVCTALRAEAAKFAQFAVDAAAAEAAYDPPATRKAPPGYHNATPAELQKLRLNEAMLEHPIDPRDRPADASFARRSSPMTRRAHRSIAFKGTTPTSRSGLGGEYGTRRAAGTRSIMIKRRRSCRPTVAERHPTVPEQMPASRAIRSAAAWRRPGRRPPACPRQRSMPRGSTRTPCRIP